jgi:hypothetical protein
MERAVYADTIILRNEFIILHFLPNGYLASTTQEGIPYLFIDGQVRYSETYRRPVIQLDKPVLARKIDSGWEQVAPFELRSSARDIENQPFMTHKRNYLGNEDAYTVDYFRHAYQKANIASVNNHITSSYMAVTTAGKGMAVAMNTSINANFAFCPFKMTYQPETGEFMIQANPFGTYNGDQILPPNPGNSLGYEAVLLSEFQFSDAAPSYSGYHKRFVPMVSFFNVDTIPNDVKQDIIAFAHEPMTVGAYRQRMPETIPRVLLPPDGFLALPYDNGMIFHWENSGPPDTTYLIHLSNLSGTNKRLFRTAGSTLILKSSDLPQRNGTIYAAIRAIQPDDRASQQSLSFQCRQEQAVDPAFDIPGEFKAKILWANMAAWIFRNLSI